MKAGKILVVDDDQFFRNLYREILEKEDFEVISAATGREAVTVIREEHIDLVITDLMMPDMDGQAVLEETKQINALIDVVVITGHATIESAIRALKSGAYDYIRKPVDADDLIHTVRRCIEQKRLVKENRDLKRSLKLFEVSRTITTCLDPEKLYAHTLDAIIQEVLCNEGGGFFCIPGAEGGTGPELKAVRNMEGELARSFLSCFSERYLKKETTGGEVSFYPLSALTADEDFGGYRSWLLVPVRKQEGMAGYVLVFCHQPREAFGGRDVENVTFIADQASISFSNVDLVRNAQQMAYMDSLTDLYNMRFLDISLDQEIKRYNRSKSPFSVLFLDLDHFKNVNDVHGHLAGSKVLIEVAEILSRCVREVDTVIRYGGDEFTVFLVETDHEIAFKVAERIRKTVEKNLFLKSEGLNLNITASIGLATYPSHASQKKQLIDMADKAMYAGKNRSRNTVYIAPFESVGESS